MVFYLTYIIIHTVWIIIIIVIGNEQLWLLVIVVTYMGEKGLSYMYTKDQGHAVYHESFKAEKFCGKLYMHSDFCKTFTESLILSFISLFWITPSWTFILKSFADVQTRVETAKLFCLETYMVYG